MRSDRLDCLDQIELPPCLERAGGGIRVAGHRVSLYLVLDALFDGTTPERMGEMFSTIPPGQLAAVIAFCERHPDAMRAYHEEQQAAFAALVGSRTGTAPTLAELRRRKAERMGSGKAK